MRKSGWTATAAALATVAILGWVGLQDEDSRVLGRTAENDSSSVVAPDLPGTPTGDELTPPAQEAEGRSALSAPDDPNAAPLLRGRAVRIDRFGERHTKDDGSFELYMGNGYLHVEVLAGAWSVAATLNEYSGPDDLELNGQLLAFPEAGYESKDWTEPEIVLVGHTIHNVSLSVRSKSEPGALAGIVVVAQNRGLNGDRFVPPADPEGFLVRGVSSPIVLPATRGWSDGTQLYWVRAPGFAWQSIDVDHKSAGGREVRLVPAGSLRVTLTGEWFWRGISVSVFDREGPDALPIAEISAKERIIEFEALPEGKVRVVAGWGYGSDYSYGESNVAILPGEQASVTVNVPEPELRNFRSISGTISLTNWPEDADEFKLHIDPAGGSFFVPDQPQNEWWDEGVRGVNLDDMRHLGNQVYGFETDAPVVGRFRAGSSDLQWWVEFDVAESGPTDIHLQLPPISSVDVELVDAQNGHPLEGELYYEIHDDAPAFGREINDMVYCLQYDEHPLHFNFLVQECDLRLVPFVEGYCNATVIRTAPAGDVHLRLELERRCGIVVTLRDGDAHVPCDSRMRCTVTDRSGRNVLAHPVDGYYLKYGYAPFSTGPGTYYISLTDLDGFRDVVDFEVVVPRREMMPIDVPLTRSD